MAGIDQAAQQRLFFNDPCVVLQIRNSRHAVDQLRHVGGSSGRFELSFPSKLIGERDEIDGLLRLAELNHLVEDAAVPVVEKILRLQLFNCPIQGVIVEQDGGEYAALGVG